MQTLNPATIADRQRVLVIQLGTELECALSRGWIESLQRKAEVDVIAPGPYAEILDLQPDPTTFRPFTRSPFDILRLRSQLKQQRYDHVLCLNTSFVAGMLAAACTSDQQTQTSLNLQESPLDCDSLLATVFGKLGVDKPIRQRQLNLTVKTCEAARVLLAQFGFKKDMQPTIIAPDPRGHDATYEFCKTALKDLGEATTLPIILLPTGSGLELIGLVSGRAFVLAAPGTAVRVALIGRSERLITNHATSAEIADLMGTSIELRTGVIRD